MSKDTALYQINNKKFLHQQVALCTLGTLFEWYDFSLFACLTPIFSQLFFSHTDHFSAMMATFAVFGSGYIMRPLGAIIFGYMGDTLGRKSTLLITILLMTLATTTIGLIPIGARYSTILLVICRLIQGFSCSGEYPGVLALLAEQTVIKRKAFVTSFAIFGTGLGLCVGALVYIILSHWLGHEEMLDWGWRIPFLLGAPLGIISYYFRRFIVESPRFSGLKSTNSIITSPIKLLLKTHFNTLLKMLSVSILLNTLIYINLIYFTNYAVSTHKITTEDVVYINFIVTLIYSLSILVTGFCSDLVNKKRLICSNIIMLSIVLFPMFKLIMLGSMYQQVFGQAIIGLVLGLCVGAFGIYLPEQFPTSVRYSGLSITLNFAASFFGGSAPLICSWLVKVSNDPLSPIYYLLVLAIVAFFGLFSSKGLSF